jgi:hypothetical protein
MSGDVPSAPTTGRLTDDVADSLIRRRLTCTSPTHSLADDSDALLTEPSGTLPFRRASTRMSPLYLLFFYLSIPFRFLLPYAHLRCPYACVYL